MKKFLTLSTGVRFSSQKRHILHGFVALLCLSGCIATQNRWQATQMRQQVIKYYNDEIIENLIRADEKLPFVHVDITSLTTIDTSQVSGTVGGGETRTFNQPGVTGAMATIGRAVMRPFTWSASPQRGNSLQISAAPVLGNLPAEPDTEGSQSTELMETKRTEFQEPPGSAPKNVTIEKTPKPQKAKQTTIYQLYEDFVRHNKGKAFRWSEGLFPPPSGAYVPGTLKRWGTRYYYINNDEDSKKKYYDFCKRLFTKSSAPSLAKELEATQSAIEGVRGLQAIPTTPP